MSSDDCIRLSKGCLGPYVLNNVSDDVFTQDLLFPGISYATMHVCGPHGQCQRGYLCAHSKDYVGHLAGSGTFWYWRTLALDITLIKVCVIPLRHLTVALKHIEWKKEFVTILMMEVK